MPLITEGYQQPANMPTGLSIPGAGGYSYPPQREMTLGQMGGVGLQGIAAALSIPRMMAWNAGPALVGRSGQGPQNGAELFDRLGMGGAMGAGLGAGLDMVADPVNLIGMGMARGGAATASPMAGRLEQMAGGGLTEALSHPPTGSLGGTMGASAGAGTTFAHTSPMLPPQPLFPPQLPASRLGRMAGPGLDVENAAANQARLARSGDRSAQLNSPFFSPELPAFQGGTPLMTESLLGGAGEPAGRTLLDRLRSVSQPRQAVGVGMDY